MFNLGYMHELGHGMPKDIHLAKRFYDMAAETSTDAKVPVAMALAKLGFNFAISNWPYSFQSFKVTISPEIYAKLELYWDIYLLTLLVGLLGLVLLVRRPRVNRQQEDGNVGRNIPAQAPVVTPGTTQPEVTSRDGATSNADTVSERNSQVNKDNGPETAEKEPNETDPP